MTGIREMDEEFVKRYWDNGNGALWGVENYNEPWEGGGISGWARDCLQYREIQKLISRAAKSVDPRVRVLGASSIMNTEDKLYSDGSEEFDQYIDVFTDHYVVPRGCYGPMVARARGKESMETETWFVGTEYQLPQGVAQILASGQNHVSPWHPRVLFENVPGGNEKSIIPSPVVAATAAFNYFVTGRPFELAVGLHNCINRPIKGKLMVEAPPEITLESSAQEVELAAGETKTVTFPVKEARPQESSAYPFKFNFTSDAGNAEYKEALNCAVAPKATITVDGNLDEWKEIPGVTVLGKDDSVDSIEVLRRPWLALKEAHPGLVSGRLKMTWDEDNLYICAEVNDPTGQKNALPMEGRDENKYFHTKASDEREPYKSWLAKNAPGRSFAECRMSMPTIPKARASRTSRPCRSGETGCRSVLT